MMEDNSKCQTVSRQHSFLWIEKGPNLYFDESSPENLTYLTLLNVQVAASLVHIDHSLGYLPKVRKWELLLNFPPCLRS